MKAAAVTLIFLFLGVYSCVAGNTVLTVSVHGQDKGSVSQSYSVDMLEKLGKHKIRVFDPWLGYKEYTGAAVSEIVDSTNDPSDIKSVTVYDKRGESVKIDISEVRKYPIMIAYMERETELPPCTGGPAKLVFPVNLYPELAKVHPKENWLWYVNKIELSR